jgi:hypothetical protein
VLRSVKLTIDRTGEEGVPEREKVFFGSLELDQQETVGEVSERQDFVWQLGRRESRERGLVV